MPTEANLIEVQDGSAREILAQYGIPESVITTALDMHAMSLVEMQRHAHDTRRPYFHMGLPCMTEYHCGVKAVIDLADPTIRTTV